MKSILLNSIYTAALLLAVPWLIWRAIRYGKNKRGWNHKLLGSISRRPGHGENRNCIWLHAVSVGEVNLLSTLIGRLQKQLPDCQFAISTSTETGYELACNKYSEHHVFFCPMDFSWAINKVLDRLNPCLVVLAELEVWPNLIRMVKRREIPLAIVNGRLSENSFKGYRRIGWLMRKSLAKFDLIAVQTETYAKRFLELGASSQSVVMSGNVKFDGARMNRENKLTLALACAAGIEPSEFVFVAGSTQPEEDKIAIDVWAQLAEQMENLRLILVPRHPQNVFHAEEYLNQLGVRYTLRSQLDEKQVSQSVLIVDTVGELSGWWGRADVAYVGGSMGSRGGQNMIEPAAFGVPVCFGPNTKNFKDVTEMLLEFQAAKVVVNAEQLSNFIVRVYSQQDWAAEMGTKAQSVVASQQGAADRTVGLLLNLLGQSMAESRPTKAA